MANNIQQSWNHISQRAMTLAGLTTKQLKQNAGISNTKRCSKSVAINALLTAEFGEDVISRFNNQTKVIQDYLTQQIKYKLIKKPL